MLNQVLTILLAIFFTIFTSVSGSTEVSSRFENNDFESAELLNNYGMPGTIDNPSAKSLPDGQLSVSSSLFGGTLRVNLSFQVTEKLTASFRYARIPLKGGPWKGYIWDRSFDAHYLAVKESAQIPSIAIGLRDFIGTGVYSGEYIVASKSLTDNLNISGGIGWGRMAGTHSFRNIFGKEVRKNVNVGLGGTPHIDHFFSGPNSPFLSLEYKLAENLLLAAEISPDKYTEESQAEKGMDRNTDLNLGFKYILSPSFTIMGMLMHGDAIGLTANLAVNPKNSPYKSGLDTAPMPIIETKLLSKETKSEDNIFKESKNLLNLEGIELKRLRLSKDYIDVDVINRNYLNTAQMIGRVVRILSRTAPPSVKAFNVYLADYNSGLYITQLNINREDFNNNELLFNGPDNLWSSISTNNIEQSFFKEWVDKPKKLFWSFYPYLNLSLFDPDSPIRWQVGLEAQARYRILDFTSLSGTIRKPIGGNLSESFRGAKGFIPRVRTDFANYHKDRGSDLYIDNFTFDQYLKPYSNIYSQINIGFLEMMYAGVRSEFIWKDANKPYGLGLDLAKVKKRSTSGNLNILDQSFTTYLASLYFDVKNDWVIQIDGGRYLAGDYGSTLSVMRNFNNGWEIGAYATITDVPFHKFGEGSFDKGIIISGPLNWFTGKKSKNKATGVIRPITGDGGTKLLLSRNKYLYRTISEYGRKSIKDNWKRVYR